MEKYPISDDIALLKEKENAAKKIVEMAIKLPFGYRKAFRAATDAEKFNRLFWKRVVNVYPVLKGKRLVYDFSNQTVTEFSVLT